MPYTYRPRGMPRRFLEGAPDIVRATRPCGLSGGGRMNRARLADILGVIALFAFLFAGLWLTP